MASMERKLTTILAADVVGFSRLMGESEEQTMFLLHVCREVTDGLIATHEGRIFGSAGDSVMAEFPSPVEAVRCAMDIHQTLLSREREVPELAKMQFRIGIHIGDVIAESGILNGDAVNIAVRLESQSDPGGILISAEVFQYVHKAVDAEFNSLGPRELKNISEPVNLYQVLPRYRRALPLHAKVFPRAVLVAIAALAIFIGVLPFALPEKFQIQLQELAGLGKSAAQQSIAVLPLQNLSGDDSDYFTDGLTNDLTTDLSKFRNLFVVASYSSFQFKNKPTNAEEISKALNVRYFLEGSVQRSKDKLRINAQLIDGKTGHHLWAERYDRQIGDVFEIQNDIVQRIVGTLSIKVSELEEKNSRLKETSNLQAYDYYLRAVSFADEYSQEANAEADKLFEKAWNLDGNFTRALSWRAYIHLTNFQEAWGEDSGKELDLASRMAREAVDRDPDDYYNQWTFALVSHAAAGSALDAGDSQKAAQLTAQGNEAFSKALKANPNDADLLVQHADILIRQQSADEAIKQIHRAMQINPEYPEWYLWSLGSANFHARQYGQAIDTLQKIREPQPRVHLLLTASYARQSEQTNSKSETDQLLQKAKKEFATFVASSPDWSLSHEAKQVFAISEDATAQDNWIGALVLAGAK